ATRAPAAERQFLTVATTHCGITGAHAPDCARFGSRRVCALVCWGSDMHFGRRVSQIFVMQISRTWKQAALAVLLALALIGFAGARSASAAPTVDCPNGGQGPNMTIVITITRPVSTSTRCCSPARRA